MRLYEKILKDINAIGVNSHMNSIKATDLKYDFHANDKIRSAYAILKYEEYVDLIFNSKDKLIYVERLPRGITYFERKRKDLIKSVIIPIIVSLITNLIIAALQWLWPLIIQWVANFH